MALSRNPQEILASATEPTAEAKRPKRVPCALTFRLEYFPDQIGSFPDVPRPAPLNNWNRVFEVSDKITLEQFATVIVDLLGWEEDHLYEFHVGETVFVHMGNPDCSDYFVDAVNPCVSCAIRLHYLKLPPGVEFDFVFDFGRWHLFRLTLLMASPNHKERPLPSLISYRGKNLLQYGGPISRKERWLIEEKVPSLRPPPPSTNTSSVIRFVRAEDHATLLKWRASNDKTLWEKAVTVLENRNLSLEKISEKIERPVNIIQQWTMAFNHRGMFGLNPPRKKRTPGEREAAAETRKKRLLDILHDRPRSFSISRASWNLPSLAKAYANKYGERVSSSSVGRAIKKAGYSIKKARRVLTSPDPEYREKVEQVLNTLQNLTPDELFFFIDELGPLRVKKYGGRTFVAKGDVLTIPQMQAPKGSITMAGALSATKNQVTWLFSPAKDTQSMIDLIEILFNQHPTITRIFLTWDAASWHSSVSLVEWLDVFNAQTLETGFGPTIQLVPLPTSSQFLDVLEAVFSGMKKAVVHHSDYQSVIELKTAVSSHFVERNVFFQENPKRAGKRIWDVDFFQDSNNLRSGDYREW
ncbi:MAG: IS630 family transposase [Acidobacteria bacterium]|nr:IS630 family transposase [Acidobacteriota bacterium]